MDRKPRILHLAKWYPNENDPQNGVFIQQHVRGCTVIADQAVVYWGRGKDYHLTFDIEQDVPTLRMYLPEGKGIMSISKKLGSIQRIIKEAWLGDRPDIIHLHIADKDQWVILEYAKTQGIPVVLTEHWSGYLDHRFDDKGALGKKLTKLMIKRVERCTTVSGFLADAIIERTGRTSIDILPNSVDLEGIKPNRSAAAGHFGVLADLDDSIKNISGILSAFAKLSEEKDAVRLSIIGDGKDRQKLEDLAEELSVSNKVTFHGRAGHKASMELLNEVDTVIINSRKETFSIVCLEAIALHKKLICTRCGGPETFLKDENVLWTRIDDNIDLMEKMKESLQMDLPTKEQVDAQIADYSMESVTSHWKELYRELLK